MLAAPQEGGREGGEGCADGVSAAHGYPRSAVAPAVEVPVPLDLTGEGSSKA